jgi:hypothetical protein
VLWKFIAAYLVENLRKTEMAKIAEVDHIDIHEVYVGVNCFKVFYFALILSNNVIYIKY